MFIMGLLMGLSLLVVEVAAAACSNRKHLGTVSIARPQAQTHAWLTNIYLIFF